MTGPVRFTILEVAVDWQEPMVLQRKLRPSNCTRLTYNWTRVMQLANTPPQQSTAPGLHPVSIHQTSPPMRGSKHPITAYYSIYRPRKDERLSRPVWYCALVKEWGQLSAPIVNSRGDSFWKWPYFQLKGSWPWPRIGSYCIPSCITHRPLPTRQI